MIETIQSLRCLFCHWIPFLFDVFSVTSHENKDQLSQQLQRNTDLFIETLHRIVSQGNDDLNQRIQKQLTKVIYEFKNFIYEIRFLFKDFPVILLHELRDRDKQQTHL